MVLRFGKRACMRLTPALAYPADGIRERPVWFSWFLIRVQIRRYEYRSSPITNAGPIGNPSGICVYVHCASTTAAGDVRSCGKANFNNSLIFVFTSPGLQCRVGFLKS
jgi:hypothetical protein